MMARRSFLCAVILALLCASPPIAGKSAGPPRRNPAPATKCDKIYARPFIVTRGGGKVQMRLLRMPPPRNPAGKPLPPTDAGVLEIPFQLCRGLGPGWRVAVGSFGAAFLDEMKASDAEDLKKALAACPVTFRRVDTTCAPCVAGSQHCPCANRDISDWIFCEKQ